MVLFWYMQKITFGIGCLLCFFFTDRIMVFIIINSTDRDKNYTKWRAGKLECTRKTVLPHLVIT